MSIGALSHGSAPTNLVPLRDLRHTYATFKIIRENMNLKYLSEQMGTSVAMIDKHYGHVEVSEIGGEIAKKSVGKMSRADGGQA